MKRTIINVILTLAFTAFAIHAFEQTAFKGVGVIESTTGGFKFPDGTVQLTAANPPCTAITYLPYVISDAGVYCFKGNLERSSTTGDAIIIQADNVVIDMNGWMLDGASAGTATLAKGIFANQRKNITIRNGTVRGFRVGVHFEDTSPFTASQGHLIEAVFANENTIQGLWIDGAGSVIRSNQIMNTGGSSASAETVRGIYLRGPGVRALNNDIMTTEATGFTEAYGLALNGADGAVVEGNRIDLVDDDLDTASGIAIDSSSDVLVVGNRITNSDEGVGYVTSTGKYRDNLTSNVTIPFTGGTDEGGNS